MNKAMNVDDNINTDKIWYKSRTFYRIKKNRRLVVGTFM